MTTINADLCPFCEEGIVVGALVCGHCLNNLQKRSSVYLSNEVPIWYLGILLFLLSSSVILASFKFAQVAVIRYRLFHTSKNPFHDDSPEEQELAAAIAPTATAPPVCQVWDQINTNQLGQMICVFGKIAEARKNDADIFIIKFDLVDLASIILIDDERTYNFSAGECIETTGVLETWNQRLVIELSAEPTKCK